jgi:hypothetical protein
MELKAVKRSVNPKDMSKTFLSMAILSDAVLSNSLTDFCLKILGVFILLQYTTFAAFQKTDVFSPR